MIMAMRIMTGMMMRFLMMTAIRIFLLLIGSLSGAVFIRRRVVQMLKLFTA